MNPLAIIVLLYQGYRCKARRSGLHIVRSDFFQKSEFIHSVAPPFQPQPACAGLASDNGIGSDLDCLAAPTMMITGNLLAFRVSWSSYYENTPPSAPTGVYLLFGHGSHFSSILAEACWDSQRLSCPSASESFLRENFLLTFSFPFDIFWGEELLFMCEPLPVAVEGTTPWAALF